MVFYKINSPEHAFRYLKFLGHRDVEEFWLLGLSPNGGLLCVKMLFRGSRDECMVDPREVFKSLLLSKASRYIVGHNHPSGDIEPSQQDLSLTKDLNKRSVLLGFDFDDHLIIGKSEFISLRSTQPELFEVSNL